MTVPVWLRDAGFALAFFGLLTLFLHVLAWIGGIG